MNEKQALKHTVRYDEGLLKALKIPKKLGPTWKSRWMSVKQVVSPRGCYWPCAMLPRPRGVLVPWRIAPASTANTCTACFQAEASQR